VLATAREEDVREEDVALDPFAPNDLPGSSTDASAAKAAVSAAAPASIHRRVRLIRVSAASRAWTAEAGLAPATDPRFRSPAGIFW
jgi:hypothetical protein